MRAVGGARGVGAGRGDVRAWGGIGELLAG
jgi:hypothetical protein